MPPARSGARLCWPTPPSLIVDLGRRRSLALAGGPPDLRQRCPARGADRRRARSSADPSWSTEACELLGWLLDRETVDGHLSVTPAGGAGPGDVAPGFDQQPIEVAALADACARAARVTGEDRWVDGVRLAGAWFDGDNDAGAVMWDPATGGGYDGLEADGPNLNQGAESTLALISTRQQVGLLDVQLAR